jgi:hypothetical protein
MAYTIHEKAVENLTSYIEDITIETIWVMGLKVIYSNYQLLFDVK